MSLPPELILRTAGGFLKVTPSCCAALELELLFGTGITGCALRGVRTEFGFAFTSTKGIGLGSVRFRKACPGISSDTLVKVPFASPTAHFKKLKAGDR